MTLAEAQQILAVLSPLSYGARVEDCLSEVTSDSYDECPMCKALASIRAEIERLSA